MKWESTLYTRIAVEMKQRKLSVFTRPSTLLRYNFTLLTCPVVLYVRSKLYSIKTEDIKARWRRLLWREPAAVSHLLFWRRLLPPPPSDPPTTPENELKDNLPLQSVNRCYTRPAGLFCTFSKCILTHLLTS